MVVWGGLRVYGTETILLRIKTSRSKIRTPTDDGAQRYHVTHERYSARYFASDATVGYAYSFVTRTQIVVDIGNENKADYRIVLRR